MATQYTKALAEYASKLRYEDLPREVVDQAKMVTLHTIGIALASSPPSRAPGPSRLRSGWAAHRKPPYSETAPRCPA